MPSFITQRNCSNSPESGITRGKMTTAPTQCRGRRISQKICFYFAAPMRQMVVPQSGHLPFVIGLPFFVVLSTGSFMIFLALHFTQYASIAMAVKHLSVLS